MADDLSINADPRLVRQILLNLLSNAIKYTPRKGRVTIGAQGHGPGWVRIEVTDTGVGIAPEKQHHVFSEFVQADAVRDAGLGGTGLGLALCQRLVSLHGGEIHVESSPGQGSRFWFTMPSAAPSDCPDGVHTPAEASAGGGLSLAGRTVLLVEDNPVNIMLMQSFLSELHCVPVVARNGHEALAEAEAHRPDLIFMDMRMPEMDGLEATRRLRALPAFAQTPIIALTAAADEDARRTTREAGCSAHLSKPIDLTALTALLSQLL